MKKIFLGVLLFLFFGYADEFELAYQAYESGDYKKANELYQKACDKDLAEACYNLGVSYANGQGVEKNYQKAAEFYQKACDKDIAEACYNLGLLYDEGKGVKQDSKKANNRFKKACC